MLQSALPFSAATFEAAAQAWPGRHPAHAAMRAMGSGRTPDMDGEILRLRQDAELAFWAGLPGAEPIRQAIRRRYRLRIAAAERRAGRIAEVETALDEAEAALLRCAALIPR